MLNFTAARVSSSVRVSSKRTDAASCETMSTIAAPGPNTCTPDQSCIWKRSNKNELHNVRHAATSTAGNAAALVDGAEDVQREG